MTSSRCTRKYEGNCVGCQYNTGAGGSRVNSRSGSGFVTLAPITVPFQRLQLPAVPQPPKTRRGPHGILYRRLLLAGNFGIVATECHHPHSCRKPATTRSQPRGNELRPLKNRTLLLPLRKRPPNSRPPRGTIYCSRICRCEDSVYSSLNTNVSISGIALNQRSVQQASVNIRVSSACMQKKASLFFELKARCQ